MLRRTFLLMVLTSAIGLRALLLRLSGWNPNEISGDAIGDGYVARMVDPTTGVGVFTPNLNPALTGIDPQTGLVAAAGTDMSFGAAIRRQIQTNVINGDFSVLPPNGANTTIVSDPNDANYNPLPGWTFTNDSLGSYTPFILPSASFASGYVFQMSLPGGSLSAGLLNQLVAVPMSQGQQYRVLLSLYGSALGIALRYQYVQADGTTLIGSSVSTSIGAGNSELKVDAGLVPPKAAYISITIAFTATAYVAEVRAAFLPAEASVGLYALAANSAGITTTETVVATATIPANSFVVGARYKVRISGTITSTVANAVTINLRVGPTTLTGTVVTTNGPSATTTATSNGFTWEGTITCRSVGATGTLYGSSFFVGSATQPFTVATGHSNNTGTSTIDTTVANLIEATVATAAGTTTVTIRDAEIVCERSA